MSCGRKGSTCTSWWTSERREKMAKKSLGYLNPKVAPIIKLTTKDIYWAAGIFEGDGCSFFHNNGTEMVNIVQKNRWLVDKLRALFGGSINKQRCNIWVICGARARGFLQTIYCLLSPRRQEQIRKTLRID